MPLITNLKQLIKLPVLLLPLAGYVQGMSDLLAPLLVIMENEVDTFWCFVGFMETVVSIHFN